VPRKSDKASAGESNPHDAKGRTNINSSNLLGLPKFDISKREWLRVRGLFAGQVSRQKPDMSNTEQATGFKPYPCQNKVALFDMVDDDISAAAKKPAPAKKPVPTKKKNAYTDGYACSKDARTCQTCPRSKWRDIGCTPGTTQGIHCSRNAQNAKTSVSQGLF
jgi:hypothetical protein